MSDTAPAAQTPDAPTPAAGPQAVAANRRSRPHLRELCDEVLASFRAAHESELITDRERLDARSVLDSIVPRPRG